METYLLTIYRLGLAVCAVLIFIQQSVGVNDSVNAADDSVQIVNAVLCYCACTELLNDLNEIGPIFTLWSNSEDKLRQPLAVFAKSVEKSFVELQTLVRAAFVQFSSMGIKCYISWSLAVYFPCIVTIVLRPT